MTGILFTPADAPRTGRRPAVVLMHGCSGMLDSRGRLPAGRREWAEQFARWGYVALHVGSFAPRGLGSLCDLKDRPAESYPWTARTADAYAALDLLAARADVDPQQVFVLGWSHGGSTVMGVVDSIRTPVRLVPNVHNPLSQTGRGARVGGHEPSRLKAVDEVKRFVDSQQRRGRPAAADGSRS